LVFDLIWTQGTCWQAIALGAAPPARPEHGKAPQDGLIFIEENDLAPAGPILQSGQFETSKCYRSSENELEIQDWLP
jgi:hypothetical protein